MKTLREILLYGIIIGGIMTPVVLKSYYKGLSRGFEKSVEMLVENDYMFITTNDDETYMCKMVLTEDNNE